MASPAVKLEAKLQVLVPVADGTEDIELACITDTLVRANLKPVVASVMPGGRTLVRLARQLLLVTETHIDNIHCVCRRRDPWWNAGRFHYRQQHCRDSSAQDRT